MRKLIVPYPDICSGCRYCEMVCSIVHENAANPRKSRIRIFKKGVKVDAPVVCTHKTACKYECAEVCPVEAHYEKRGLTHIDPEKCIGCGACIKACPYHAIVFSNKKAVKCDLCNGKVYCVKYCPMYAIKFEMPKVKQYTQVRAILEGRV